MIRLRKSAFTPPRLNPLLLQTTWSWRTSKLLLLSCATSADISEYGTPPCDMSRAAKRPASSCAKDEELIGEESTGRFHGLENEFRLGAKSGKRSSGMRGFEGYRGWCLARERIPRVRNVVLAFKGRSNSNVVAASPSASPTPVTEARTVESSSPDSLSGQGLGCSETEARSDRSVACDVGCLVGARYVYSCIFTQDRLSLVGGRLDIARQPSKMDRVSPGKSRGWR